ncbi:MAG TPA: histidine ammonia-lyase [Chitinophagaceae bacterium]|nr:histidine ammonia-lyase [Chitinophagaceae bacterium]HML57214.1 histidine ammonia-lyase [Ferruginibacter sp.]
MSYNYLPLDRKHTSFQQVQNLLKFDQWVSITFDAHERILYCRSYIDEKMKHEDQLFYGINTGFGYLQHVRIDSAALKELQSNLIQSHACGMGERVPVPVVKLMMMLKIKSLSYGHSGVQIDTVKRLMDMYNAGVWPVVYTQGSLGASGDLAPLSHLCLPLLGKGEVEYNGKIYPAAEILQQMQWEPIALQSKEGLALINGTQFMSAYGLYNLIQSRRLMEWANVIAAISFDAFDGVADAFHPLIHQVRPHAGQISVAQTMRNLLQGSAICNGKKTQVQDPYSFRCIPQVHGATVDTLNYVEDVFIREINSVTDNPNVFPEEDLIISGGNFHGQPLALAADFLSIAMSELASISERRTYQLISGSRGLPAFLIRNPGLHSGFMIPQYTAAGIVSENKQLCTPASVDTIPSSNNQEDHVSMGANAATKCKRVIDNVEKVLAIELMTAVQALELRRPLRSSETLESVVSAYREKVAFNDADRILHDDMMASVQFLQQHSIKY